MPNRCLGHPAKPHYRLDKRLLIDATHEVQRSEPVLTMSGTGIGPQRIVYGIVCKRDLVLLERREGVARQEFQQQQLGVAGTGNGTLRTRKG